MSFGSNGKKAIINYEPKQVTMLKTSSDCIVIKAAVNMLLVAATNCKMQFHFVHMYSEQL